MNLAQCFSKERIMQIPSSDGEVSLPSDFMAVACHIFFALEEV